jgi:4-hydroxyproline epimerase
MRDRIARFADEFDHVRKMAILEPRGSDAIVGALLCEPHGSIGVAVTLAYLGKIGLGESKLETPVGVISVNLVDENTVTVENVSSYRYRRDVTVDVPELGMVTGDIAWGGNWFFLCKESPFPINLDNERALTDAALKVQNALWSQGITGRDDGEIDHIEFFTDAEAPKLRPVPGRCVRSLAVRNGHECKTGLPGR